MAVLSENDRAALNAAFQTALSRRRDPLTGCQKFDIRAAVDAADGWIDTNAASFNSALPADARTALSAKQKAELLVFVVERRYQVS